MAGVPTKTVVELLMMNARQTEVLKIWFVPNGYTVFEGKTYDELESKVQIFVQSLVPKSTHFKQTTN